jgi:hypothetical protein
VLRHVREGLPAAIRDPLESGAKVRGDRHLELLTAPVAALTAPALERRGDLQLVVDVLELVHVVLLSSTISAA